VLEPGQYTGGARFDNKAATIVGIGATIETIDLATSEFFILNGSSIVMRDVNAGDLLSAPNSDIGAVIDVVMSELRVDNMSANTSVFFVIAASAGSILTLNHSRFVNTSVRTDGRLIANACTFFSGGPSVVGSVEITNSIVITDATKNSISISGSDPIHPTSEIINNTFVGGAVSCELVGGTYRLFEANIFFNHAGIQSSATCVYNYNLATPGLGTGASNIAGDPLFVDATNNDFHIKLHSPAIDATDPAALSNGRDFDGVVRPQGTRSDIGAFEYVPQNQPADHVVLGRH
jgi:hypothetical protein